MKVRTRSFSRASACILATLTAMAGAAPARADVLTVTASGTIGSSCSLTKPSGGDFGAPNLSASGFVTGQATVTCNTGFKISATSLNKALKNTKAVPANFANTVAYTFSMSVPVDSAGPVNNTGSPCAATVMTGTGCVIDATGKTAVGTGGTGQSATLQLNYTVPTLPTRLIAGSYSDTITLTIATSP